MPHASRPGKFRVTLRKPADDVGHVSLPQTLLATPFLLIQKRKTARPNAKALVEAGLEDPHPSECPEDESVGGQLEEGSGEGCTKLRLGEDRRAVFLANVRASWIVWPADKFLCASFHAF